MLEKLSLLAILLIIGFITKDQKLIIPVIVLMSFVLLQLDNNRLDQIKSLSIKYGIILITIFAFIPIAKGDVTYNELLRALTSFRAWIAISAGILVTYFARNGINFMDAEPDLLTFILVGIIIGIVVFKGVATGPLIGSGIAVLLYGILDFFILLFD